MGIRAHIGRVSGPVIDRRTGLWFRLTCLLPVVCIVRILWLLFFLITTAVVVSLFTQQLVVQSRHIVGIAHKQTVS